MSNWFWLSKVGLFGLLGTAGAVILLFPFSSKLNKGNSDPQQVIAITPENLEPFQIPVPPPPSLPQTNQKRQDKKSENEIKATNQKSLKSKIDVSSKANLKGKQTIPSSNKLASDAKFPVRPFNLRKSLTNVSPLFATPVSLGMLAIGVAEGNYRVYIKQGILYVEQTANYFGHTDPGNLSWGEVVTNYGPCSDQGRSGGDIAIAEKLCLQRAVSALPTHLVDLHTAGIDPNLDVEALLNTADLYNQASPIHSRRLPQALAIARQGGLSGVEAVAWARTASFYLNSNRELDLEQGENKASGLIGICARENLSITEWQCVHRDQLRRAKAISDVLKKYIQIAQLEERA
ncbi:MAG: hypothetical protein F6J89_20855 [Symploca sp. SIO1C4]|uniref:Uncharacterized protein n=1 Tax=Symploca sp. SIO1C4 TaxID=2607765 RepID=A0A6B3NL84_9CYAN|nr:hypothetical protein [Symploca sp. SIO1C4]